MTKEKKKKTGDSLGGSVVKKPPSNAGDVGFIPGWGIKIPYAVGQPSLNTLEPNSLNYWAHGMRLRPNPAK